ncbi:hypothetical protein DM860_001263 [Cuscuta australis]|uniref:ADF-H domain-containing protein n=1 Tax=Cuscuta australis TaxID=267555 RepID=A0A328DXU9_9ASTE|nr:hypothetical protein DM860_001263 [Cuscuta australis]
MALAVMVEDRSGVGVAPINFCDSSIDNGKSSWTLAADGGDGIISHKWKLANSASGVGVVDECKLKFLELKAKRCYRYIVFKIDEARQVVVVEKLGTQEETHVDFTNSLPSNECRYAVFDYDFTTDENCQRSRIFFISWSPETARVRSKMVYASSKDRFRRELDGVQVELQATDASEMSLDIFKNRAH